MQSANFDTSVPTPAPKPQRRFRRVRPDLKELFDRVVKSYVEIKQYPVVSAVNIDPDPTVLQQRWRPALAHFCCDIELITERVLGGDPALESAWFALAQNEPVNRDLESQVINRCGLAYRDVDPRHYFGISSRFGLEESGA